jgi:hypothetical protein
MAVQNRLNTLSIDTLNLLSSHQKVNLTVKPNIKQNFVAQVSGGVPPYLFSGQTEPLVVRTTK